MWLNLGGLLRRRNSISLLAITFLLCLHLQTFAAAFRSIDCKNVNENQSESQCQCSSFLSDFEIECPRNVEYPKFRIYLRTNSHIQVQCNISDAKDYKLLPQLSIGSNPRVQIQQCPLPDHAPIATIYEHLGVSNVNSLIFETSRLGANITPLHFSRLSNLTRLRFSSSDLERVPPNLLGELKNLTWLDIRTRASELPSDLLVNLRNLNLLEVTNNKLTGLPVGMLRNQHNLLYLNLWSNQLRNLSKSAFDGATSLYDLDLSSNKLEHLPADVFSALKNMSLLHLSANHFRDLPEGLFEHNKNLSVVRLINNRVPLPRLPARLFGNLPLLRVVRITCDLESAPSDLFVNSRGITNISLANNALSILPGTLLEHQSELQSLDLSNNKLVQLPEEIFQRTTKLVVLDLSNNRLSEITRELFTSLVHLEELNLQNNRLTTIHQNAFMSTTQLRNINLSNNRVSLSQSYTFPDLNSPFQNLHKLKTLILRNNTVMFLFNDWKFLLKDLERLDLSYNNISSLDFSDLQFVVKSGISINLTHNQIHRINFRDLQLLDYSQSQNKMSIQMDLGDNPLICDCMLLHFVKFLNREFAKEYNKVIKVYAQSLRCGYPANLEGRSVLDVQPKELLCPLDTTTDQAERQCPRGCTCDVRPEDLTLIVACNNQRLQHVPTLPVLPSSLKYMELNLENSQIRELPPAITPGYANVTKLYLRQNNLTQLNEEQLPCNLSYIDVRYNQLQELNTTALQFFNRSMGVDSLRLSYNPWRCDCKTKPMLQFMQDNYRSVADRQDIYCMSDAANSQLPPTRMEDLTLSDICPEDRRALIALAVIALLGVVIFALAAIYYKYQMEIKIWLYAHNLCMWFVTEEDLDKEKKYDAFISYSHKDEQFIVDHLVPQLEHGPIPFKLCVHERDFMVGGLIPEQIVRSVDESRRTIVVLSPNFIESEWARMEFSAAHKAALNEGRARVIVIIYSDVGNIDNLDADLKAYLKMNTYLKWGDPWFWDKLRYAMPHRSGKVHSNASANGVGLIKTPAKSSQDDKLELIKPSAISAAMTTPPATNTKNPLIAQLNGGSPHTAIMMPNGFPAQPVHYTANGKALNGNGYLNGHINGAFVINTNSKQSDV